MKKAGLFLGGSGTVHSNFKKSTPAGAVNKAPLIALQFIGSMFAMLGLGLPPQRRYPENQPRYARGKRAPQRPTRRSNMKHISKRVRRRHRRAA